MRGVAADVGTAEGCDALIEAEPDVDVLVNNAATFEMKPVFEIPDEDWTRYFETNVMSGIRLARHHIPRMVDRGWGRDDLHLQRVGAAHPRRDGALRHDQDRAAGRGPRHGRERAGHGGDGELRAARPHAQRGDDGDAGGLGAGRASRSTTPPARFIREARPTSLLGRPTSTDEVANLVVYVASELSSGSSGAALRVDGGVVRAIP